MARREPLRKIDLALLSVYGFFLFAVFVWMLAAAFAFQFSSGEQPVLDWAVRGLPPWLALTQGAFYVIAARERPFRQRLMVRDATSREALRGAATLCVGAILYGPLLVN